MELTAAAEELHQTLVVTPTPTLTLAYWLTHCPSATSKDAIEAVHQLAQQIIDHAPDNAWVRTARLLQTFVEQLDTHQRANLVESLAQIVTRYDQPRLAESLRTVTIVFLNVHASRGPTESGMPDC
ncbi:hypothetical protein ACFWN5_20030 [Streptomyces sp. NPDC058430]|uniref:hypothetical protein n=1 Tax=Streptomyces sp. NPDC058430 TaxID=3346495 RepID=UPI003669473F